MGNNTRDSEEMLHRGHRILNADERHSSALREQKTLLLVDDCKDQLTIFKTILENQRYRVLVANSAAKGLELLEREQIDLVVSDIMMPDMSGTEFLQVIRQTDKLKNLPVIMLTAGGSDFKQTSLMTGADMFCSKSSAAADLPRQIDFVLHTKG
ncbi:MAG: response regulator [Bdellovibrionales bacterium]|nr:response regulator [Bdellovibrionales bacterium]